MAGTISERATDTVSSGSVSVWELLRLELVPRERPENSVTAEEVAAKTGYSVCTARRMLKGNPQLRAVQYKTADTKRAGLCYVPREP